MENNGWKDKLKNVWDNKPVRYGILGVLAMALFTLAKIVFQF